MTEFVKVATLDEVPAGGRKMVEIGMFQILIFNIEGEIYALEDMCTHDGGPLGYSDLINGCEVQCPRHGARFDVRTGAALCMPAFQPVPVYETRIEGNDILIESPE